MRFDCCFSVVVTTVRFQSAIFLCDSGAARFRRGLVYSLLALVLGPWGVPWDPIHTAQSVWANLHGGTDVTAQLLAALAGNELPPEPSRPPS